MTTVVSMLIDTCGGNLMTKLPLEGIWSNFQRVILQKCWSAMTYVFYHLFYVKKSKKYLQ